MEAKRYTYHITSLWRRLVRVEPTEITLLFRSYCVAVSRVFVYRTEFESPIYVVCLSRFRYLILAKITYFEIVTAAT